jgi:hypothetical protein
VAAGPAARQAAAHQAAARRVVAVELAEAWEAANKD